MAKSFSQIATCMPEATSKRRVSPLRPRSEILTQRIGACIAVGTGLYIDDDSEKTLVRRSSSATGGDQTNNKRAKNERLPVACNATSFPDNAENYPYYG
jgi:hypothetical protein